jgi:starch synthase
MKILFVSSEVIPFSKTGGLADVAGSLPAELSRLGHEVKVVTPRYKGVDKEKFGLKLAVSDLKVKLGESELNGAAYVSTLAGSKTPIYFIENDDLYGRDGLYQKAGVDYEDNAERFIYFSRATLDLCERLDWKPDVVHCNDWQTGLIPVYLKSIYAEKPFYQGIRSMYTIHNLAYQGVFPKETMELTGLHWDFFTMDKVEFWGKLNFMKSGIVFADTITTVSEQYSREIQTEEYGCGLEGVLQGRQKDVFGIVNGVDYKVFSPEKDPMIAKPYSLKTLEKKNDNKKALLKQVGLPTKRGAALIGIISRLADQKGFDLIAEIIEPLMIQNVQLVILGTGDPKYHTLLQEMEVKYPKQLKAVLAFDAKLAQQIYAGSDFFLMPSQYEPCGLGQLISLKYGTIPIVRETGGLADTITDFDLAKDFEQEKGNGFVFLDYLGQELLRTILRALAIYKDEKAWNKIQHNAMRCDFSWKASAKKYEALYSR